MEATVRIGWEGIESWGKPEDLSGPDHKDALSGEKPIRTDVL